MSSDAHQCDLWLKTGPSCRADATLIEAGITCSAQREFLAQKLEEVEGKLKEAKADRRESERERTMLKAVTNMKQLFTGAAPAWGPYI